MQRRCNVEVLDAAKVFWSSLLQEAVNQVRFKAVLGHGRMQKKHCVGWRYKRTVLAATQRAILPRKTRQRNAQDGIELKARPGKATRAVVAGVTLCEISPSRFGDADVFCMPVPLSRRRYMEVRGYRT